MIQALNRLPNAEAQIEAQKVWCRYHNDTRHIQVARIENIPCDYFERVIFPGDRLVFKTFPHAWLEIYTGELCSALLSERILCDRLKIGLTGLYSGTSHHY
ncbi:MAG: hypothetical protein DCF15_18535 [Phormidesmis priestleyi]|uniref:DUF1830 domain-containing protein n=1 Tax=Phormidesmis priestleyi TaxID=268141 RepID=A0A2W4X140_9CYAN|nr:MAG: hypothetical protein DCF15_18535 [Phormidesmis priestleyi]